MVVKIKKWKDVVDRWEDVSTQRHLTYLIDSANRGYKHQPYVEQFFSLISAFVSTIYTNAYSYDNLTRVLYAKYSMQFRHTNDSSADELNKQRKLFTEILKTMPKGFKDYSFLNGCHLSIPEGTPITINKANQFLDYFQSRKFSEIMLDIVVSNPET